jgi:predicted amidohydrolase
MFCCPYSNKYFREYGEELNGPAQKALSEAAKRHGIYLIGGSLPELEEDRVYNTSFVYDREGKQIARHRKAHLFDIDVPGGQRFFESEVLTPGQETTTFETEFGLMGLCICFDFRSQEIAKTMGDRGAKVLFVPAAFNMTTGPAHWELTFRSQALYNQVFTVGTAPARDLSASYHSWGHSIIVDPWGTVVSQFTEAECIQISELDLEKTCQIREQLPLLKHRRTDLYDLSLQDLTSLS